MFFRNELVSNRGMFLFGVPIFWQTHWLGYTPPVLAPKVMSRDPRARIRSHIFHGEC